jgi:hypothetical protein
MSSKKNYYIFLPDPPWAGPVAKFTRGPDKKVNRGVQVGRIDQPYEFELMVDPKATNFIDFPPLDVHGPGRHLLFSQRLIDSLSRLGITNIEYLPALVTYVPTNLKCEYKVANIVGVVSGLDRENSEYLTGEDGTIYDIKHIVLNETKFLDQKIFRLKEDRSFILVHSDIKKTFDELGYTGVMFIKDEEWEPGMI